MPINTGTRAVIGEAASWLTAAAILAAGVIYHSELKALVTNTIVSQNQPTAAYPSRSQTKPPAAHPRSGRKVRLKADRAGHFRARAYINGRPISILVDTGATLVALSHADAQRAGHKLGKRDYTAAVRTANGTARVAPITLKRVEIGGITLRNIPAVVSEPGRLSTSLLGMSFLSRLSRVDMRRGQLVLTE